MPSIFLFLQIHELFEGQFNWRGVLFLSLFILMGLLIVGFSVFAGYKAFQPRQKNK